MWEAVVSDTRRVRAKIVQPGAPHDHCRSEMWRGGGPGLINEVMATGLIEGETTRVYMKQELCGVLYGESGSTPDDLY